MRGINDADDDSPTTISTTTVVEGCGVRAADLGCSSRNHSFPGGGNARSMSDDVAVIGPNVPSSSSSSSSLSTRRFDAFLTRNNRQYIPDSEEYRRRMSIHDANINNLARWNEEHAGRTMFVPNEFMDMEVEEVLYFRGGVRRSPRGHRRGGENDEKADTSEGEGRGVFDENDGGRRGDGIVERGGDNLHGTLSLDGATVAGYTDDDDDDYERSDVRAHRVPEDFDESTLPASFDWREHRPGSIGPVKDEGFCGSCWAFSLASTLESNWFVATGHAVDVPEQFIVDCAWDDDSSGCDGGNSDSAARRIIKRFRGLLPTREFVDFVPFPISARPHRRSFVPSKSPYLR
jgi:hypothetical protein